MPLKKKTGFKKIMLWMAMAVLLALMLISFSPVRHVTEVVLI